MIRTSVNLEDIYRDILVASNVSHQQVFDYGLIHMGLNGSSRDKRFLNFIRHLIEDRIEENKRLMNNLTLIIAKMERTEPKDDRPKSLIIVDGEIEVRESTTDKAVAWIMDPENKAYSIMTIRDILCQSIEYNLSRIEEIPTDGVELYLYLKNLDKSPFHIKLWAALSRREDINDLIILGSQKAGEWMRSSDDR